MKEALTITTERVDDIPLLLAQMQRMGLARLLDAHFPTHGNREGLSLGVVTMTWLTHIHAPADHRMNRVQPWAERRLETLRGCPHWLGRSSVAGDLRKRAATCGPAQYDAFEHEAHYGTAGGWGRTASGG